MPDHHSLSVHEAADLLSQDPTVVVLDVRTQAEFESHTGHLSKSLLIPVDQIERRHDELLPHKSVTIIVYCRTGRRSAIAADFLVGKGYTALNMLGGIVEWNEEQLPVERR